MNAIVLIGFMGAGKTTVGRLLSQELEVPFIDFDQALVERLNMSIADYFDQFGEEAFRKEETALLHEVVTQSAVLSTGGGIVLKELNRKALKQMKHVIFLQAEADTVYHRVLQDHDMIRPLAQRSQKDFIALYESRLPLYQEVATITVDTTNKTPDTIVSELVNVVKEAL